MNGTIDNKDGAPHTMDVEKSAPGNDSLANGGNFSSSSGDADPSPPPNAVWPIKDSDGYVVVPFTYGSIALWQGKRAPEFQTFRWHVYVRGANNEDLSPLIDRVVFQLHPSFNNPTRVLDQAPFHVTELGWGEFDVGIRIHLHEGPEQGIELRLPLKLFSKVGELSKRPVVSERLDELVFNRPSETVMQQIRLCNRRLAAAPGHAWSAVEPLLAPPSTQEELLRMHAARRRVQAEMELIREEVEGLDREMARMTDEVRALEPAVAKKERV
mmetsp:Transcript_49587/g.103460  ORF Transcript_49587/g.103460 Transcript_49587/m.103460 type:complete len:270 (-) Transcript_49587:9-818(-)